MVELNQQSDVKSSFVYVQKNSPFQKLTFSTIKYSYCLQGDTIVYIESQYLVTINCIVYLLAVR